MIVVVDGINAGRFKWLVDESFRLRARVFQDRLGWDVQVEDGKEHDVFDTYAPSYILSLDDTGSVVGCMRLLQTLGPNMLADVFNAILQGQPAPRSPFIWEATRFCVDTNRLRGKGTARNSISYVTSEVMIGAFQYAQTAGVTDAVAVIDPVMNRVMCRSGNAPYDYLGKPTPMGKVTAMAALMDCSEERIMRLREFAGIDGEVILSEDEAEARFGDAVLIGSPEDAKRRTETAKAKPSSGMLDVYCTELLTAASTSADPEELDAALRLIAELQTPVKAD